MLPIAFAVAPVFLLIIIGWALHRKMLLDDGFWAGAERLTYYLLFPALLFQTTATTDIPFSTTAPMLVAAVGGTIAMAGFMLATRSQWRTDPPAFTSYFQGSIRPNTYVGFAVMSSLAGEFGLSLIAAQAVVIIPLVNFLSVLVLLYRPDPLADKRPKLMTMLKPIVTNPLILACIAGGTWNIMGLSMPPVVAPTLTILGGAALPIALICTGAGLDFKILGTARLAVTNISLIKLLVLPTVAGAIGFGLGIEGWPLIAVVVYAGLPVSVSSYVLARQLGGDGPLVATIITATTVASAVTLPLLILGLSTVPGL